MDELIGDFTAETREMLERIGEALLDWENSPDDRARLDEIFRFVHTVKGSCGFLDLPRIEALAHAAESALAGVRDGTRSADTPLVATMLAIIDRIALLVSALEPGAATTLPDVADDAQLIEALDRRVAVDSLFENPIVVARTVRVAVPLLESMMNHVSELVLVRNEMARELRRVDDSRLQIGFERLSAVIGELREGVTRTRMQPIERLFSTLPRLVHDTARDCGKQVELEISGQDVEIDREMVEAIRDPLVHIVRNAIDHGIEHPDERVGLGKPRISMLRVIATQSGNQVGIEIADDGRGIDTAKLVALALSAGRIDTARATAIDADAAAQLIFEAGVSTAAQVTTISGRGVGMDVVRANVERLGGSVTLANRPGAGLSVTLRAPLTLSIVNALVVRVGAHRFAIPRAAIDEVVALGRNGARIDDVGGGLVAVVRNIASPTLSLGRLLEIASGTPALVVMMTTPTGGRFALGVDAVDDHEELVVRPMAPVLAACGVFAGQSLSDDGQPIVVLDPVGLALRGGLGRLERTLVAPEPSADRSPELVLLASDIGGRRIAIRAALVERLIEIPATDWASAGERNFAVVDGRHLPVVGSPTAAASAAILLNDGMRRAVLAASRIDDLVQLPGVTPVGRNGVEALFRWGSDSVALLDGFALFEDAGAAPEQRPVASILLTRDAWSEAMLAPLIAAAGYRVVFGEAAGATLAVHVEGDESAVAPQRIALATRTDGSVAAERYDRASLSALVTRSQRAAA